MSLRRTVGVTAMALGAALALFAVLEDGGGEVPRINSRVKIDLPRYMGAWHVISNIPYFAEKGKLAGRDVYKLDADGNVDTTFIYRKSFDEPEKSVGSLGIVQPGTGNAYWRVRFFWLFRADYLILDIAPDYSWALVGQPSRRLGWVLARNPAMDDALYASLLEKFRGFGYDTGRFLRVPQFKQQVGQPGFQ